ncbi:MAG: metallophosphoesterase, partial [Lachnobacterium sp.]|nr:metallophosphoesterase [Lachnobacterium sp.]
MSLYAIGDFHLSFLVDKPMEVFDPVWKNHEKKIGKYWNKKV